jgi:hypothetical protein
MGAEKQEKATFSIFLPRFFCQLMTPKQTSEIKPRIAGKMANGKWK